MSRAAASLRLSISSAAGALPAALLLLAALCAACSRATLPARPAPGASPPAAPARGAPDLPRVLIATELGELEVEVDSARAPITAANFLRYVDAGAYAGGRFHRTVTLDNQPANVVRIEVVQGGLDPARFEDFPPIPLERTSETGLSHVDGAISMARDEPDTATSDFFICIGPQPELDFGGRRNPDGQGFAAFGRVVSGMGVVRRIHGATARGQILTPAIRILGARRIVGGEAPARPGDARAPATRAALPEP